MSRYRPIAPKPAMPCVSEADRSVSSAISFDNLSCRQVPEAATAASAAAATQKSRRVRKKQKRDVAIVDTQRPSKRAATVSSSKPHSEKYQTGRGLSCGLVMEGAQMKIEEDAGFMERAAASAPSSVFLLEKRRKAAAESSNHGYGGCFTEMIRGIVGLPTAAHVHNLLQHQQQQQQQLNIMQQQPLIQHSPKSLDHAYAKEGRENAKQGPSSDAFWSCFTEDSMRVNGGRGGSEEQQQSGLDEEDYKGDDGRRRLITLNLLPEAPSRGESPTISSCTSSCHSLPHNSASANSYAYIEQVYSHSSEPVVLVEDSSQKVLWVNRAYERACKDYSSMLAPFIDPLGIPTQLGQFKLQLESPSGYTSATLLGFLKKLVVETGNQETKRWVPYLVGFPLQDGKLSEQDDPLSAASYKGLMHQQQHSHGVRKSNGPMTPSHSPIATTTVIMPQPIRLVGSAVSLETITEFQEDEVMAGSVEFVKRQLEEGSMPAFITDASNVVRWVNTAYKHMVGQPECPWLVSTVITEGGSPTITGEVLLSCNVEIPSSTPSFSGRANIQWTRNTGERSSMTVPCDVCSLADSNCKRMLVWRFDIQASLSLTCGVKR